MPSISKNEIFSAFPQLKTRENELRRLTSWPTLLTDNKTTASVDKEINTLARLFASQQFPSLRHEPFFLSSVVGLLNIHRQSYLRSERRRLARQGSKSLVRSKPCAASSSALGQDIPLTNNPSNETDNTSCTGGSSSPSESTSPSSTCSDLRIKSRPPHLALCASNDIHTRILDHLMRLRQILDSLQDICQ